ncbi:MAG TPA: adenylate/guanylate cyclase domain-containing protein [Candidatus Acidoferrum sp.]|nr:adenylate/guanylate cyclase domain-containing protein [Candidatus Acidoferrum sp.]
MSLGDDLRSYVKSTFGSQWKTREGSVVPSPEDVTLDNTAVHFEKATILYADLAGSTNMVDNTSWSFAAEIYKNYLYTCSRLIRNENGEISAYDGDRVMGVFIGDNQCSRAAKCALKINYTVKNIINPAISAQYSSSNFSVAQCVGIDISEVHVSRTGVRGDNDLVWVGKAANYAAKLTDLSAEGPTWITEAVFSRLSNESKYAGDGTLM